MLFRLCDFPTRCRTKLDTSDTLAAMFMMFRSTQPSLVRPSLVRPHSIWPGRVLALLLAAISAITFAQKPDSLELQRQQFRIAHAAATLGSDAWRVLASGLADYPLYPYLEAAALKHDIEHASNKQVAAYLKRYPDLIPAQQLRVEFLEELAKRKDWDGFNKLYRTGLGDAITCYALQARLAAGETLDFDADLAPLWTQAWLPGACSPVQEWAHDHGLLTRTRLWQRIEHAAADGPTSTIRHLADWLPADDARVALRLAQARSAPHAALDAALQWPDTARSRTAVTLAMSQIARRDSDAADRAWPALNKRFDFSAEQRHQVAAAMALYTATDFSDDALKRLIALPAEAQTATTREWRARVALAKGKWKQVLAAIEAMPASQQAEDPWEYWRARALVESGQKDAGTALFRSLADEADYYGFLSADWLDAPYAICPLHIASTAESDASLLAMPGFARAFELFALDMLAPARREWMRALDGLDAKQRLQAADLAYTRGWYDRAIFALASDGVRHYEQRFPIARKKQLFDGARAADIDPAWAYAILRAESAWVTDARSGANARGLMQLLPATAAEVARKSKLPYSGASDLSDPAINIPLGTRYLGTMAAKFNGAPWLASAAYNAGASKVSEWVAARSELDPDIFVATIPYGETRAYVRRVMAFAVVYDWRLNGTALPIATRMPRIGDPYTAPTVGSVRKKVRCPAQSSPPQR